VLIAFFALTLSTACAPKLTFDVSITNQTDQPVTVGVIKEGDPYEHDLGTPEDWALESPQGMAGMPPWGHVIPPGRTIDSGQLTGQFPHGTTVWLRAYAGERTNIELLAVSSASPDRVQVLLFPGHNEALITHDPSGGLRALRTGPQPAPR
jgi:hypothetical protein